MEVVFGIFGVVGSIAGVAAVWFAYLERRERRHQQAEPEELRYREHAGRPSTQPPAPGSPPPSWPVPTPPSWDPMAPVRAAERFAVAWRSLIAYLLFGFLGALMLRSRRPAVRFHAWQSIGIDVVWLAWFVVGVIYNALTYGRPMPPAQHEGTPSWDPVVAVWFFGLLYLQVGPRVAMIVQVIRGRPGRLPLLWWIAARRAGYGYLSPSGPA